MAAQHEPYLTLSIPQIPIGCWWCAWLLEGRAL
jgi:hypothetical protein